MKKSILDCTLRDGGYINEWNFSNNEISKILISLKDANIDIIECGYLNDKKGKLADSTLFSNLEVIDNLLNDLNIQAQKVVMINLGDYDVGKLKPKKETNIDGIRLAFHKKDLEIALQSAKTIVDLGYKLYFQPMISKNYEDIEFLSMIEKVNAIDIYSFYIVDSFGSMSLEEFNKFLVLAHNNLNKNISLGYHSHNNMQLAFSNAISMCSSNIKRDIIVDSSIYGIGRGAGNLNTELIADYLNTTFEKEYKTLPLLEIIDEYLNSLMKKKSWGFSPAQFLSASVDCHPNYASYLINKNTNHIVSVQKILSKIEDLKKSSFDKNYIDSLYINALTECKTPVQGKMDISKNKKILLIASGTTVDKYKSLIEEKVNSGEYITISLNHKANFICDYFLFSNQKRFDEFQDSIDSNKLIITSNIVSTTHNDIVLNFENIAFVDKEFIPNVAIISLNYFILKGYKNIEIAGFDGYDIFSQKNYSYAETNVISDTSSITEQNIILEKAIKILGKKINIEFITPSLFKKGVPIKILGVIPARYKSSRFEGKPLCLINNVPMIKRTYNQAIKSKLLTKLIVATDDIKIKEYCESENIPVVMTSDKCLTGTDRIAEVAEQEYYDLYVNIQGDEPVIDPLSIDEIVSEFKIYGNKYMAYNLYKKVNDLQEVKSDTIIKVITTESDELMYMSRHAIPFNKSDNLVNFKKQVCVYGFTKDALELFSGKPKTVNEQFEDIELLRFLDLGYKVKMKETNVDSIAVDVPTDIKKVEAFLDSKGIE